MAVSLKGALPRLSLRSVYVRSTAVMILCAMIVAGSVALSAFSTINQLAREGVVDQVNRLVDPYAEALAAPLRFGIAEKIAETLDGTLTAAGLAGLSAIAFDANGAEVAVAGDAALVPDLQALARTALDQGSKAVGADGLWVAAPLIPNPDAPPIGVLAVAMTDAEAMAAVASDKWRVGILAAATLGVLIVAVMVLMRRMLGLPMTEVRAAIERVGAGDYDTPVPLQTRSDELGGIARDLHRLVEVLTDGRAAEQQRKEQHAAQITVVERLGESMDALAKGVLSARLHEAFPGDYEALRANYHHALDSLNAAIGAVQGNAQSISNGAEEIARASDDLSKRTETQAATLEQTAAALDELLASVRSAAANAEEADTVVNSTRAKAADNDTVMRNAMSAMGEIEKTSSKIAEIITVIDDIAFQTNLLALNAGVEAARAGASGKGFAVVASEVRALAQRSSEAAHQIKDLINGSTEQVKQGAVLVQQAGSAFEEVVQQVGEISDLVSSIAQGASEQAQGLSEINTGVTNLDQVTQQNAAMVEESTAAAHTLRSEAAELSGLVRKFTLDPGYGAGDVVDPQAQPNSAEADRSDGWIAA